MFGRKYLVLLILAVGMAIGGSAWAGITDGLVGHWSFDDCTAIDGSGNGNNGNLKGGISCIDGKQSKALNFNGVDAYIQVPYSSSLDAKDAVTISAWVNVPDGNPAVIVEKGQTTLVWDYGMTVNSGLPGIRITNGDAFISSTGAKYNTWQHFTVVLTNNSVKTYLNGSQINGSPTFYGGSSGSYLAQSGYGLQIGLGHPGEWFKGALDEVRIYNRALSDAEVQQLYSQSGTTPTTQRAKVTSVTVGEAIQAHPLSISVTGEALTSDLEVALDDCDNLQATGTPSATQRDYSCTPNSTGLLNGYVKAAPGERSLYNFSVTARDAQPTVVIAKVLPERAQLNKLTKFTVIGANLPSGLGFTVNDCEYSNVELAGGTATRRYFQCTPKGTIGSKTLLVKTKPGGSVLYQAPTEISEIVPDRDYVRPNVYGSSNALSLDADFNIADEDVGATGEYYIAANASGTWAFFDGKAWVLPQVAVARGALTDRRIPILKDLNVTQHKGIKIFAGYGRNISDMLSSKKYLLLKNLEKTALNDEVSELPQYALEAIEAIDDGSVTLALASTQVGFLRVGSVFLVGQSPRKVSSIVAQGTRTVINTEDPTVADVLDKITVDTEINLSAQHFEAPSAPTITVSAAAIRTGNDFAQIIESNTPTSYTYELKDHVIYDANGSAAGKVIANGKIVIDKPKITAKVDYTTYGVSIARVEVPKAVNLGFSAGQSIDITLSTGKFGFKNKKSIALGQFWVPVQAGLFVHVPIYLTFGANGNASISASFSESSTLDIKMTAGFNPVKISGSANPSFDAAADFTIQGTIGASVSLDPKVHLKFGNIALAGLESEIGFHARAKETIKNFVPCVDINVKGGLSSSAYVMVPDVAISWKKVEVDYAKKSVPIIDWEAPWSYKTRVPANCTL